MERKFDYKSLVVGDIVKTSYGVGKVVDKHGEMYIEFDDGSGASLHEATSLSESAQTPGYVIVRYGHKEPCDHKGCLRHVAHPCEGCGRFGGYGGAEVKRWKY